MEPKQTGPLADVHAYLKSKDKDFTADLPAFEQDMQDDGARQQVYDYLKGQDKQFTASFDEFSQDLGVKKKPSGVDGSTSTAPLASPAGAGVNPAQMQEALGVNPDDIDPAALSANQAAAGYGPLATGVPQPAGSVEVGNVGTPLSNAYVGPLAAPLSELRPAAPGAEQNQLDALPVVHPSEYPQKLGGQPAMLEDDTDLVALPADYKGGLPTGLQQDDSGNQYFRRPISNKVDGKEQSRVQAFGTAFANASTEILQGVAEGAESVANVGFAPTRALVDAIGGEGTLPRFTAGTEASEALENTKGKLAPLYTATGRQNVNTVTAQAGSFAPMVLAQVAQTLAPETRLPALLKAGVGLAGSVAFDAPIIHGAHERAKAAGLTGTKADLYTVFESALTLGAFKLGGKLINQAGDAAVLKTAPKEFGEAVAMDATQRVTQLEQQLGRAATQAEQQAALGTSLKQALPKLVQFAKGTVQQGLTLPLAGAVTTAANQAGARALGGKPEEVSAASFWADRKREAISGLVMGGVTEGVGAGLNAFTTGKPLERYLQDRPGAIEEPQRYVVPGDVASGTLSLHDTEVIGQGQEDGTVQVRGTNVRGEVEVREVPQEILVRQQASATTQPEPIQPSDEASQPTPTEPAGSPAGEPASQPLPEQAPEAATPAASQVLGGDTPPIPAASSEPEQPEVPADVSPPTLLDEAQPHPDHVKPLTKQQQAANDTLDALDRYNALKPGKRKGKEGSTARAEIVRAAKLANINVTVGGDGKVTLADGRRLTRSNEYTATTPAQNHVPLGKRPAEARPFIDAVLATADTNPSELQGLGIKMRGKELSGRELTDAVKDIRTGKNTLRAQLVLDALENGHRQGYLEKSTGTGLATRKFTVPTSDYLGKREGSPTGTEREPTDAELQSIYDTDPQARQAVDDYTFSDGTIDYKRLANDEAGLPLMFDVSDDTATRIANLARERANQPPAAAAEQQTNTSQTQSDARVDEAAPGSNPAATIDATALENDTPPNSLGIVNAYLIGRQRGSKQETFRLVDKDDNTVAAVKTPSPEHGNEIYRSISDGTIAEKLLGQEATTSNPATLEPSTQRALPQGTASATGGITLAEQNRAAKTEFTDALTEFRAARKKGNGTLQSSILGIPAFSAEEAAALTKMAKAAVKLGAIKTKQIVARLREMGLDDDDATNEQLTAFVKQFRKDEGLGRTTNDAPASGEQPAPSRRRAHAERYSDETREGLTDDEKNYVPTADQRRAEESPADYIKRVGADTAYEAALGRATGEPRQHADLIREVGANYVAERTAALKSGDTAAADAAQQRVLRLTGALAKLGTETAQALQSFNGTAGTVQDLLDAKDPARAGQAVVDEGLGSIANRNAEETKQNETEGKQVDKQARKLRKVKMRDALTTPSVQSAIEKAAGSKQKAATKEKSPSPPDSKDFGKNNRWFTKEGLAEKRKAEKGQLFSSLIPVSPVVLYEGAYYIEGGVRKFSDWSAKMVRSYGAAIRPRLAEIYEESKKTFIAKGGDNKDFDGQDAVSNLLRDDQAKEVADYAVTEGERRAKGPQKPGLVDPIAELINTLKKKVNDQLSKQKAGPPRKAREAIAHALQNRAEYADVFEQAKAEAEKLIDKLPANKQASARAELQDFYNELIGQPYADSQFEKAYQQAKQTVLPDGRTRAKAIKDAALDPAERAKLRQSLMDDVTADLPLGSPEQQELADHVGRVYDHEVSEIQRQETDKRVKQLPSRVRRLVDDAVALSTPATQDAARQKLQADVIVGLDPNHAASKQLQADAATVFDTRIAEKQQAIRNKAGIYDLSQTAPSRTPTTRPSLPDRVTHLFNARASAQQIGERLAPEVVSQGIKDLGTHITAIAKKHATDLETDRRTLTDKFIQDAGLTPSAAKAVADAIQQEWGKRVEKGAWQTLRGRLQIGPKRARAKIEALDKLINDLNAAANLPKGKYGSPAAQLLEQLLGNKVDVSAAEAAHIDRLKDAYIKAGQRTTRTIGGKPVETRRTQETAKAAIDLLQAIGKLKNVDKQDWSRDAGAIFFASLLSSPNTHLANAYLNALATAHEVGVISNLHTLLTTGRLPGVGKGLLRGYKQGAADAAEVVRTGIDTRSKVGAGALTDAKFETDPLEEHSVGRRLVAGLLGKVGIDASGMVPAKSSARVVRRALGASDTFFQGGLAEARAQEIAQKMAVTAVRRKQANGQQMNGRQVREYIADQVDKILFNTPEALTDINAILNSEGLGQTKTKAQWIARQARAGDLLMQARASQHPELVADALGFAARHAGNSEYEGHLGALAYNIAKTFGTVPVIGKIIVPFARVTSNFQNRYAEWTGLGFYRAVKGGAGKPLFNKVGELDKRFVRDYTPEENQKAALRSLVGTLAGASAYALAKAGYVALTGLPTGNRDQDRERPAQSVVILKGPLAGTSWTYKGTNEEIGLTAIGQTMKWAADKGLKDDEPTMLEKARMLAVLTAASTLNTGPTNSAGDFLGSVSQVGVGPEKLMNALQRLAVTGTKAFVIPSGVSYAFQLYNQATDASLPEKHSNDALKQVRLQFFGDVPYWHGGAEDALDVFGDPMTYASNRFYGVRPVSNDPDKTAVKDRLAELDLMPDQPRPTDAALRLYDPENGKRVTSLSDGEYREFLRVRGNSLWKAIAEPGRGNNPGSKDILLRGTPEEAKQEMKYLVGQATQDAKDALMDLRVQAAGREVQFGKPTN